MVHWYLIPIHKILRLECHDMLTLPAELTRRYETLLTQQGITMEHRPHYRKWLCYYQYGLEPRQRQSFPPFDEKLRGKHQCAFQRHQADRLLNSQLVV